MKKLGATLRRVFRLGDFQAILIILSAAFVDAYALTRLEPSSLPAMAAFLYSVYGLIVLIVKTKECSASKPE